MWKTVVAGALALWTAGAGAAAELKSETVAAFDSYIRTTEARIADQASGKRSFLWTDESPQRPRSGAEGANRRANRGTAAAKCRFQAA